MVLNSGVDHMCDPSSNLWSLVMDQRSMDFRKSPYLKGSIDFSKKRNAIVISDPD